MRTFRTRALALAVLAVLGVSLAVGGTGFGVDDSLADSQPSGEFVVSETNVTVLDGDSEVVIVENVSDSGRVTISEDGDSFSVETTRPLTERERERAVALARANDTVASYLQTTDASVTVEPIPKLSADQSDSVSISVEASSENYSTGEVETFSGTSVETDTEDSAVTVETAPDYVDDEAAVRITDPDGDPRYSLVVDLAAERIASFTDYSE